MHRSHVIWAHVSTRRLCESTCMHSGLLLPKWIHGNSVSSEYIFSCRGRVNFGVYCVCSGYIFSRRGRVMYYVFESFGVTIRHCCVWNNEYAVWEQDDVPCRTVLVRIQRRGLQRHRIRWNVHCVYGWFIFSRRGRVVYFVCEGFIFSRRGRVVYAVLGGLFFECPGHSGTPKTTRGSGPGGRDVWSVWKWFIFSRRGRDVYAMSGGYKFICLPRHLDRDMWKLSKWFNIT